jgi:hypothetical protein
MAKKKITNRSGKKKHKNSIREIKESISNSRWFLEKNPICNCNVCYYYVVSFFLYFVCICEKFARIICFSCV